MRNITIVIIGIFLGFFSVSAKNFEITVLDSASLEPVVSATVEIKCLSGKEKDSVTYRRSDRFGKFSYSFTEPVRVRVRFVGFKDFIDTINNGTPDTLLMSSTSVLMQEVVTTGQFIPQSSQKSVYAVKVVSEAQIEAQAAPNLRDLLTTESNMRISQDQTLGTTLSINGISGENVKIMIDGVPVIGRMDGNLDISQINLNNAASIEIIEGPMSTIYGSDALGGVINIITKDKDKDGFNTFINGYFESIGTYNSDAGVDYKFGKDKISLSGGRNFFGGYSPVDTSRNTSWDPKEQYFSDWQYSHSFSDFYLRYSGRYFHEKILNRGNLFDKIIGTDSVKMGFDDVYQTGRLTNSIFGNAKVGENKFIDLTLSFSNYTREKNQYTKNMSTLNEILTPDNTLQDTAKSNAWLFRGTFSSDDPYSVFSYQAGTEYNYEDAYGSKIEDFKQSIQDFAAYLSMQYKPYDFIILQPAIRFLSNSKYNTEIGYHLDMFGSKIFNIAVPIIPSLNIKVDIFDGFTLRFGWGRGFRAPSIKELYLTPFDINHSFYGNTELKAEKSINYNLNLRYELQSDDYVFRINQTSYFNEMENLVTLAKVGSSTTYTYINIFEHKTLGFNISFDYFLENLSAKLLFAYNGSFNNDTASYSFGAPEYRFTPEVQANLMYLLKSIDTKISLFYKFTGSTPGYSLEEIDSNDVLIEYLTESYNIMDISVSKDLFDKMIEISAGIKNIFDINNLAQTAKWNQNVEQDGVFVNKEMIEKNTYPTMWGRTFFVKIKLNI